MKKAVLFIVLSILGINLELNAQSIPINNDNFHYYGPNSTWGEYLKVGGNGRGTSKASVVATNGNLHLDSKDGSYATYINHYSKGNTYLNTQGGLVGIGTATPDPKSGMHMYQNRYTLYGPNSTWGAYLQVGGNGRTTANASVVATNGNLHLDSKEEHHLYLNHYSKGNTYLNTQGGLVGIGTATPDPKSGMHMYQNRYTLYGPNTTWGAYLQVGGNGRTTANASVVATNGNLHLDSKEEHHLYLNHYSKGNTYLNTQGGLVGIGTATPDPKSGMHMYQNRYTLYGPNTTWGAYLQVGGNGRTTANASVVATNGNLHLDSKEKHHLYLNHYSKGNTYLNTQGGNVGIGTTDTKGFKLGVKGKIAAEEIMIALHDQWADFVFYDNYELPTLDEVESHIKEKGHLKDIPSAEEVKENGVFLGEMDAKLLQKIEELTLYTIQQEKKIRKLEKENLELKSVSDRVLEIEKLLKSIKK